MEETFNAKAIVLRRRPFREADSKVTVYTSMQGKMELVARGTSKTRSKLAGHIEPFNFIDLMVIRGRQYNYVGSAISKESFLEIRKNTTKIQVASEAINLFNVLIKPGETDENLFFLLYDYLKILDTNLINDSNAEIFKHFFIFKFIILLGYKPELEKCVNCSKTAVDTNMVFDFVSGGISCCPVLGEKLTISQKSIKILRLVDTNEINYFTNFKEDIINKEEIISIVRSLYNFTFC